MQWENHEGGVSLTQIQSQQLIYDLEYIDKSYL